MRKNVVRGYKMFDAADISSTITSPEVNVINLDQASIFVSWSGSSPYGTLEVQFKNGDNGAWFTVDMGGPIPILNSSGQHILIFHELPHTAMRLVYSRISGTGTIDAVITAKQVGG